MFAGDELIASEKDRAENVMIVDLLRNDLSRVCQANSVRTTQLCQLEQYEYVLHLVSAIEGKLRMGMSAVDLLRAAFPGGSITGAPKVRAMQAVSLALLLMASAVPKRPFKPLLLFRGKYQVHAGC